MNLLIGWSPTCSVTSLPRAPPLPGAPAHSAAGGRKARSHCRGEGPRPVKAVRKPAKCSFRRRGPRRRGEGLNSVEGGRGSAPHQGAAFFPRQCRVSTHGSAPPVGGVLLLPFACVPGHLRFPPPAALDFSLLRSDYLVSLLGPFPLPEGTGSVTRRHALASNCRRTVPASQRPGLHFPAGPALTQ